MFEVLTRVIHDTSGNRSMGDITNRPCCTITVGVNSVNSHHYKVESYLTDAPPAQEPPSMTKPPYRVPLMRELRQEPRSGYKVASTFSGGGGSCTGYYMAGFQVVYANEFIEAARETYAANHPTTFLDPRDIRTVTPESILKSLGLKPGELDLFDGSPPCSAFSTAGKREAGWGKAKNYSDDAVQVVDDLFFEYARLLKGLQPKVFIAENVSGLVKGSAKGYFKLILAELKACGYQVEARLLNAAWLGVPQARERLIFMGVRNDLNLKPVFPKPLAYQYTVRDALPWIQEVQEAAPFMVEESTGHNSIGQHGHRFIDVADRPFPTVQASRPVRVEGTPAPTDADISTDAEKAAADIGRYKIAEKWDGMKPGDSMYYGGGLVRPDLDRPCNTVTAIGGQLQTASVTHPTERRKFTIPELKRICAFPDDYELTGSYAQQWERCGRSVPPLMMYHIAETVRREILDRIKTPGPGQAGPGQEASQTPTTEADISSAEEKAAADITRFAIGEKWDQLKPGGDIYYGGRLVRPDPDKPCLTVTAMGGVLSAASVTHPTERRKFTIPELKRICAFPDDYQLTGNYSQQYERLGRSVPPVMMRHIAETVRQEILDKAAG